MCPAAPHATARPRNALMALAGSWVQLAMLIKSAQEWVFFFSCSWSRGVFYRQFIFHLLSVKSGA